MNSMKPATSSPPSVVKNIFSNFYRKLGNFTLFDFVLLIIHIIIITTIFEYIYEYVKRFV